MSSYEEQGMYLHFIGSVDMLAAILRGRSPHDCFMAICDAGLTVVDALGYDQMEIDVTSDGDLQVESTEVYSREMARQRRAVDIATETDMSGDSLLAVKRDVKDDDPGALVRRLSSVAGRAP